MITCDQVASIVAPCHGTDSSIVSLQNGLKIESYSIPKSKFSSRGTCEDSLGIGCPLNVMMITNDMAWCRKYPGNVDGTTHLVHGHVHKLCRDSIHGIIYIGHWRQILWNDI